MNAKVLEKKFIVPFVLITSLFCSLGICQRHYQSDGCGISNSNGNSSLRSGIGTISFYGGYGTMAIPAALFASRYSYKAGILLGLALYAIGAFFILASCAI